MADIQQEIEKEEKAQILAGKVMKSVQMEMIAYMPYLNRAILQMPVRFFTPQEGKAESAVSFGTDGESFYAMASIVMQMFEQDEKQIIRMYLHSMMHCLFSHMFTYERLQMQYWDLAADMAVENVILNLNWDRSAIEGDDVRRRVLNETIDQCGRANAETIYAYLCDHEKERNTLLRYGWMFRQDRHDLWGSDEKETESKESLAEKWKEIQRNTLLDGENYEKARGLEPGSITRRFILPERKKQDYTSLLQKFAVYQEELKTDVDSFDYIYYTYGLQLYDKMPLIEPLEYRVDHHIRDFVIAVDTSGSTQGDMVRSFIAKTYDILSAGGIFAEEMNVYLMQCDAKVQEEVCLHSKEECQAYLNTFTIKGMGGTDFRPVFERISALQSSGALPEMRGLIYFTDGQGEYPKNMPPYQSAFVMLDNQKEIPEVPSWAIRMIVSAEEFER